MRRKIGTVVVGAAVIVSAIPAYASAEPAGSDGFKTIGCKDIDLYPGAKFCYYYNGNEAEGKLYNHSSSDIKNLGYFRDPKAQADIGCGNGYTVTKAGATSVCYKSPGVSANTSGYWFLYDEFIAPSGKVHYTNVAQSHYFSK